MYTHTYELCIKLSLDSESYPLGVAVGGMHFARQHFDRYLDLTEVRCDSASRTSHAWSPKQAFINACSPSNHSLLPYSSGLLVKRASVYKWLLKSDVLRMTICVGLHSGDTSTHSLSKDPTILKSDGNPEVRTNGCFHELAVFSLMGVLITRAV